MRTTTTLLSLFLLLAVPHVCAAANTDGRAVLTAGMSMGDVITNWGDPTTKVEHETNRYVVWEYPWGNATFHEGRLSSFSSTYYPKKKPATDAAEVANVSSASKQPIHSSPDVMREVLSEVPSDSSGSEGSGNPASMIRPPDGSGRPFQGRRHLGTQ